MTDKLRAALGTLKQREYDRAAAILGDYLHERDERIAQLEVTVNRLANKIQGLPTIPGHHDGDQEITWVDGLEGPNASVPVGSGSYPIRIKDETDIH